MDPRNLHIRFEHVLRSVVWDCASGNEYFLVGDGEQFYLDQLQAALDEHFSAETVLASPSRHEAIVIERSSVSGAIASHVKSLGTFTVFDQDLHTFMQFSKTGVARKGQAAS